MAAILARAAAEQRGHAGIVSSGPSSSVKDAAKRRAAELVGRLARAGDRALEIGAESGYRPVFEAVGVAIVPLNLPDDMHAIDAVAAYDGAIAMHVLEHSPFPAYVLAALHRAVRPGGWLYVAVPHVTKRWVRDPAHFSVLHPDAWARLLAWSGWQVEHRESGKLAARADAVEERFLCVRGVA